ncbi:MAG: redoxin domain-containing protein [Planctomycetes bacterium]|nr:redoxin domain-containing protein [Planctomycetota bacterium]
MRIPVMAALILFGSWSSPPLLAQTGQEPAASTRPAQDPVAEYKQLVKDLNAAVSAHQQNLEKLIAEAEEAAKAGKPIPAIPMVPPTKEFIDRALTLAEEYAGKGDAVRFLVFIVKNATDEKNAVIKAFRTLVAEHTGSPDLAGALRFLGRAERFIGRQRLLEGLAMIEAESKTPNVIANVHLLRGTILFESPENDEQRAAGIADLEKVATVTDDEDLKKQAAGVLFEARHLAVGCQAPEIEAQDTDGVAFKLSDYRGKVVLLDFWGFW